MSNEYSFYMIEWVFVCSFAWYFCNVVVGPVHLGGGHIFMMFIIAIKYNLKSSMNGEHFYLGQ